MKKRYLCKKATAIALAAAVFMTSFMMPGQTALAEEPYAEEVVLSDGTVPAQAEGENEEGSVIYSSSKTVSSNTVKFEEEDWMDYDETKHPSGKRTIVYDASVSDATVTNNFSFGAKITIEEAAYNNMDESAFLKVQPIVKVSDEWSYTKPSKDSYLGKTDFSKADGGYEAVISSQFSVEASEALKEIDFEIVGQGFEGTVTFSDVVIKEVIKDESHEVLIYTGEKSVNQAIDFEGADDDSCWEDSYKKIITYDDSADLSEVTLNSNVVMRGKLTIDEDAYNSLAASGSYLKLQGVLKSDKNSWMQGGKFPSFNKNSFGEANGDNSYTVEFEDTFSDIDGGSLQEIDVVVVGVTAKGTVTVSDITLSNIESGEAPLPEKDATIVDNFESAEEGTANGWKQETGWEYNNMEMNPVVEAKDGNKMLKLHLDYTGREDVSWSEAKVKKSFTDGLDVSAYNRISYELIYPKALDGGVKAKVFADDETGTVEIINKDTTYETETLADGSVKGTVTISFTPNETPITNLTIGVVGVNTSFVGDVYLDNIVLSQYNAAADFVDITVSANELGSQADVRQMPTEVSLSDPNATAKTRALYAYLQGLDKADQVLFGHQNDTHKHVTTRDGVYSDTKDVTGSISGLVGIDSLALTGTELGLTDTDEAIQKAVEIGKAAAKEGAILTLSTHMPNMSNAKVKATPGGKRAFDFSECDFNESKDLSNNCAEEVLPGGKYNAQFTAYLDIIADYAKGLGDIPVLFRPFHENTGGWFWWGSATTSKESYNAMFRYTKDYLESVGVHNFIYVYSPNGPLTDTQTYMSRYPGDDCVDIVAFDYYDDYNTYPAEYSGAFVENLRKTCQVVKEVAEERGKVAAISETGVRVMKADGSDNEGLLVKDNPIQGQHWYSKVNAVAMETGMPYYLVWANFSDTNFYVPYKYDDTKGHELINEFIEFYNEDASIFADGTNFYGNASQKNVTNTVTAQTTGYFTNVFEKSVIKTATTLKAAVKNAKSVSVELANGDKKVTVSANSVSGNGMKMYEAEVTAADLAELGQTDIGTVTLKADGKELVKLNFISFGKDKEKLPANVVENFELYYGDDDYLDGAYSENSAANCFSKFELDSKNKKSGSYGGAFHYGLKTSGSEVWTGRKKSLDVNDFSAYNALSMWVKPDGKGQKLVIQLVSGGEDFEVYLTDFVKTTDAKYVVIPFSSFKGKNGGTFNPKNVEAFAVWCNSIPANGAVDIDSAIVFDDIQFVTADKGISLTTGGYALSDTPDGKTQGSQEPTTPEKPQKPQTPQPEPAKAGTKLTSSTGTYIVTDSAKRTVSYAGPADKKVKSVTIPKAVTANGVTYQVTAISAKAFYNCKKLTKVTIPETVITIGANAFAKCTALKKITIPKNVTTIDKSAFSGDKNLKSITIKSAVLKKVGSKALKGIHKKAVIKVPKKQLKSYQKLLKGKGQAKTVKIKK